jgi:ATP-dependent RNA helicase RhlE
VTQLVYEVPRHLKTSLLLHLLQDPQMNMVLVFSRMKHGADRIARQLEQRGVRCATLHSNRSQNQRLRALKDFKDGVVRVLVATDIAARGIDVDGISHVVNYDFPMHPEDYVHRIGRTGRANAVGDAISFVSSEDHGDLRTLERFIGRGLVRKKAEGFNYSQQAQAFSPEDEPRRFQQGQNRLQRSGQPQRPHGHGGQPQRERSNHPQRPQRSDYPQRPWGGGEQPRQEHAGQPQRSQSSSHPQRPRDQGEQPQQERSAQPQRPQHPQRSGYPQRPRGQGGQPRQERSGRSRWRR